MRHAFVKGAICAAIFLVAVAAASARPFVWVWPWPHTHHRIKSTPAAPLPDCDEINAVARKLPPERYELALRSATKAEQKIITDCEAQPWSR